MKKDSNLSKNFLLVFLILLFVCQNIFSKDKPQIIDNALNVGIAMGLPGISVAIGAGDSLLWSGTAGYKNLQKRIPLTKNDRFGIGSITKTFVARVILQLVEEGKVDLNKKATDYVKLDLLKRVPNANKATIRNLVNHQSGVPTWEFEKEWMPDGRGKNFKIGKVWGKTETLNYITDDKVKADFAPGEKYSYSNTNYTILGLVVEAVTGNDVASEIRHRILEPLKLQNTFFESFEPVPGGYVNHYHYATPKFIEKAGLHSSFKEVRPLVVETSSANLSPEWAAGGMISSATDLVRWAQCLKNGELLKPEMQKEVFAYYPPANNNNKRVEYLQGVMKINDSYKGKAIYGHSGGTLGFVAYMFWFEDTDTILVMQTNIGTMHCGLSPSPVSLFYKKVLIPAVMKYLNENTK